MAARMPVSRFAPLVGIPERTYRYRLARRRAGDPMKGPWPAPRVDAVEALAAKYATDWPAWGHRKIAALMRADGHEVSTSTVERALRRRGLLLPRGFRADRKSWAMLRRRVFHDPPTERNRVWQTDFTEFETTGGGIWRICAVIDYATKYCLAATVTPTSRGADALACLNRALAEATRLTGCTDLRDERGMADLPGPHGEIIGQVPVPIAVVSDNGPCFRGEVYATAFTGDDPLLRHVRTRVRSPQTNGVVERFFGTLKYEDLYRCEIADADALAVEVNWFRHVYNTIRPHQALDDHTPRQAYLDPRPVPARPDTGARPQPGSSAVPLDPGEDRRNIHSAGTRPTS
jgi:transposase InsO family protein